MRSYCRLKTGLAGFLLIYLAMALFGLITSNYREIFPFYSWFLFSVVPNPDYHYGVTILENRNYPIKSPVPYDKAVSIAVFPNNITSYQYIQKMGRAHDSGNVAELKELTRQFDQSFLRGATTYQLTRTYYDPIERWHGKEAENEVLQTFRSAGALP